MKKSFLFRLLAITFICLVSSLAIKSETNSCKATCYCTPIKAEIHQPLEDDNNAINYKTEIFFIKI